MGEQKLVELKVRIPEKVVDFVREQLLKGEDEAEYWTSILLRALEADADKERLLAEYLAALKQHEATDEFEKFEIRVPARIVRFLEAFNVDVKTWLEDAVVNFFVADQDGILELWQKACSRIQGPGEEK